MRPQDFYVKQRLNRGGALIYQNLMAHQAALDGYQVGPLKPVQQTFKQISHDALGEVMQIAMAGDKSAVDQLSKTLGRNRKARLVASLIADWSFDAECSEQEKIKFLVRAPRLRRQIERVSESIFVESARHE
ncbi:hypothetical protein LS633_28385 [Pseudomonas sp. NIBR-H-19]|uniref:hypothetical protein n=1 Tax=Pseudomonas sp. NIBR-H-19 TaxID=2901380 RepID=UPI001E2CE1EA|nr:hypothetical protein [Pseudomonas sp. NIBR-H-19]UHC82257.1 hypothetical protein LS633_28385 [Pseudomonas sp. NIBR-H-19]